MNETDDPRRTWLVTGANRGLGLEFCRQLLARGERVVAGCRTPARAETLVALASTHPGRLQVFALDVGDGDSIASFAARVRGANDRLHALVNCAGILPHGERPGQVEADAMARAFAINAMGPLLLAQALAPLLVQAARPVVLNLSSELGSIAGRARFEHPSYAMSKAALNMATRQLAHALAPQGVVCFAVCPGWVRTDMGGPRAPLTAAQSVASLIALMDRADPAFAGRFLDRNGEPLPW